MHHSGLEARPGTGQFKLLKPAAGQLNLAYHVWHTGYIASTMCFSTLLLGVIYFPSPDFMTWSVSGRITGPALGRFMVRTAAPLAAKLRPTPFKWRSHINWRWFITKFKTSWSVLRGPSNRSLCGWRTLPGYRLWVEHKKGAFSWGDWSLFVKYRKNTSQIAWLVAFKSCCLVSHWSGGFWLLGTGS